MYEDVGEPFRCLWKKDVKASATSFYLTIGTIGLLDTLGKKTKEMKLQKSRNRLTQRF